MDIYIKWKDDTESIQIPVLPESFELSESVNNTTVNVHNLGDINLKGKKGLNGLSFESFFPCQNYGFLHGGFKSDPYESYISKINKLVEDNTTVHVIITETDINGFFTIESFIYGHSEKVKDIDYSIGFIEYKAISSTSDGTSNAGRDNKGKTSKTVKWKKGDTWQKITKSVLGSSKTWKTQQKNNKSVVTKAKKAYKKKHPKVKTIKEATALIGYKVVIKK